MWPGKGLQVEVTVLAQKSLLIKIHLWCCLSGCSAKSCSWTPAAGQSLVFLKRSQGPSHSNLCVYIQNLEDLDHSDFFWPTEGWSGGKYSLQDIKQHLGLKTFGGGKEWGFIDNQIFLASQFWGTLSLMDFKSLHKWVGENLYVVRSLWKRTEKTRALLKIIACGTTDSLARKKRLLFKHLALKNLPWKIKSFANIVKNPYLFGISQFCLNLMSSLSNALRVLIS